MDTEDHPTCGKGLAENSILPARLSNLIAAMAGNLAVHMKALDLTDTSSRTEYQAYEHLVKQLRQIAVELQWTANEMAGYRDLPMGIHDQIAMTQPEVRQAFENFVEKKQELIYFLEETAARDHHLLGMMRSHGH